MKRFIYADNFRGFSSQFLDLPDVTFLVGENSSGKSSILSLIDLLSAPSFWMNGDFNTPSQHFGGFKDIVSASSKNKKNFTVGFCQIDSGDAEGDDHKALIGIASFKNVAGVPYPYKYTYLRDGEIQNFVETANGYRYRTLVEAKRMPAVMDMGFFSRLVRSHSQIKATGGSLVRVSKKPPRSIVLVTIPIVIEGNKNQSPNRVISLESINYPQDLVAGLTFAPIRMKPQRVYQAGIEPGFSPEGGHTPYLLKERLRSRSESSEAVRNLLSYYGEESGMFSTVRVHSFGREENSPFEIQVSLGAMDLPITAVGYGVSQVLPILAEVITSGSRQSFHIQQPEVHLHPKAQAALGDIITSVAVAKKARFVIETHSDFLIDRVRFRMKQDSKKNRERPSVTVVWFEHKDGFNSAHPMPLSDAGDYPGDQPAGFRKFFIDEQLRLLGLDAEGADAAD